MTGSINPSIGYFNQSLVKSFVTAHHLLSSAKGDAAKKGRELARKSKGKSQEYSGAIVHLNKSKQSCQYQNADGRVC